jgi:hypothetical protein
MLTVVELRPDSLTVLLMHWGAITVCILKMLESGVREQPHALKEPSDCKEALPPEDVWRSATIISGAQCVMMHGVLLMLKWPADSWDSLVRYSIIL